MKPILDLREAKAANKTQKMVRYIPKIVKNCSVSELIPILSQYSDLDSSTIYMDYEALVHYRVKHSKNEFSNNHINDI